MTPRRAFLTLAGLCTVAGSLLVCKPADAHNPRHGFSEPYPNYGGEYSVSLQSPGGGAFPSFWHGGSMYVAGNLGEAYTVTVQNHTGRRVEAVVSVDGRDVISGEVGDYRKQRGYIIEPYASVSIDGFRQSLDAVAAFRFSALRDSYSARRGTPQNVGVVGVAVFEEQAPRPTRRYGRPVQQTPPRPYYDPHPAGEEGEANKSSSRDSAAEPPAAGASEAAPYYDGDRGRYAPSPYPEQLGTEYGETRWSSVREVSFRRKNKRRPEALLTVYYDSLEGLRARGIPTDPYPHPYPEPYPEPYPYEPQPFPHPGFSPPPPRRY